MILNQIQHVPLDSIKDQYSEVHHMLAGRMQGSVIERMALAIALEALATDIRESLVTKSADPH